MQTVDTQAGRARPGMHICHFICDKSLIKKFVEFENIFYISRARLINRVSPKLDFVLFNCNLKKVARRAHADRRAAPRLVTRAMLDCPYAVFEKASMRAHILQLKYKSKYQSINNSLLLVED